MVKELATMFITAQGIVDGFTDELDRQLSESELVKLKMKVEKKKEAARIGEELAKEMKAEVVQVTGHTVVMYRPKEGGSDIKLAPAKTDENKHRDSEKKSE